MGQRHLLRGFLLLGLILTLVGACEPPPVTYSVPPSYYYVVPTTSYLRSCASYADDCYIVAQVYSGDRPTLRAGPRFATCAPISWAGWRPAIWKPSR